MLIYGTVTNAVKLQTLSSTWQQKKESGNVLSKKEQSERENWTQEDWLKHDFQEQAAQNRETSKKTDIDNKILSGSKLTQEEEKYLEKEDPATLQRYRQAKAEKEAYEEKLKHCRTKDEVQRLKTEKMGEYLSSIKSVENDPHIPESAKLANAQEILAKTRNIQEAEMKFIKSPEYSKLPTEAEEAEERSEERETADVQVTEKSEKTADVKNDNDNDEAVVEADEENDKAEADVNDSTDDSDIVKDIEETFHRIQLSVRRDEGGNDDVRAVFDRKAEIKIDVKA
jgi:hypothetical protein